MRKETPDPRTPLDVRLDSPAREGLTGTTSSERYVPARDREQFSIAPDFGAPEAQPAWRQDFPIDWPQDQYVERRDFMKFLVLTSLAMTAGQVWIAVQSWFRQRRGLGEIKRITALDAVPIGGAMVFNYPGPHDPCVLVRLGDTDLVAYSQKCTHLSCAVIPRPDHGILHCPCHEGYFDLRSGRPIAGPPPRPLPRVLIELRGREVYATGMEARTS